MKHKNPSCLCCGSESKYSRCVDVDNLEHVILCNTCNLKLINKGEVRLNDETVLRTKGYRGDFIRVVAEHDLTNDKFWDNRKRVRELAMIDNQSMVGWDVHESY